MGVVKIENTSSFEICINKKLIIKIRGSFHTKRKFFCEILLNFIKYPILFQQTDIRSRIELLYSECKKRIEAKHVFFIEKSIIRWFYFKLKLHVHIFQIRKENVNIPYLEIFRVSKYYINTTN